MSMIISRIKEIVSESFKHDNSGHDWNHIKRVYDMACFIQEKEGGNLEIIQLAALLHDISDHKLNGGILNKGGEVAYEILMDLNYAESKANQIKLIIDAVSFKGAKVADEMPSLEGKIVQDADRLDAIGAIGIARAFAYGSAKNQPMYNPLLLPNLHDNFENYANAKTTTINHFHEKLLLLKDRLHTATARKMGEERHAFLKNYIQQFEIEWNFNTL